MVLTEHTTAASAGWVRRDTRPIWQAADNRYGMDRTRGHGEKWQVSRTPWAKQILEDVQNPQVREVVLMAGSQCAKTAPMLITLAWSCANRPSPKLWVTGNDDLAKDASMERIQPTLERCPDTRPLIQDNRLDKTTWKVRLTTCTIDIAGAQSSTVLEQNPYAEIFGDEVRQWPEGSLQKVEKRQRSYTNAKRYLFSTPDKISDEFHQRFMSGTRSEWVWPCMKCGAENKLEWKGLKYDSLVAVYCQVCSHPHEDNPGVRRHIVEMGRWLASNPTPQNGVVSYHWNALLPPWVRWRDLVDEWIRANELKKQGNIEPLKVFICETLGEPWEERAEDDVRTKLDERKCQTFYIGNKWPEGTVTLGAADVQKEVVYWSVRSWASPGRSMLEDCGKVFDFAALQETVVAKYLKGGGYMMVDSGFKTEQVYLACQQYGWKPTKGTGAQNYHEAQTGAKRLWRVENVNAAAATRGQIRGMVRVWEFSNDGVNDTLSAFMTGESGDWQLPVDVPHEYISQLLAVQKMQVLNKDKLPTGRYEWRALTRDDHWRDCEKQILVGALDFSWQNPKQSVIAVV